MVAVGVMELRVFGLGLGLSAVGEWLKGMVAARDGQIMVIEPNH